MRDRTFEFVSESYRKDIETGSYRNRRTVIVLPEPEKSDRREERWIDHGAAAWQFSVFTALPYTSTSLYYLQHFPILVAYRP